MGLWEDVTDGLMNFHSNISATAEGMRKNFSEVPAWERIKAIPGELAARAKGTQEAVLSGDYSDITNISPMGVGSIGKQTWKAMTPEARAALNVTGDMYPELMKKTLLSPGEVMPQVAQTGSLGPTTRGLYTRNDIKIPGSEGLQLNTGEPRLTGLASTAKVVEEKAAEGKVLGHELQHHETNIQGKVEQMDPRQALDQASMLLDVLPHKYRGSVEAALRDAGIDMYNSVDLKTGQPLPKFVGEHKYPLTFGERKAMEEGMNAKLNPELRDALGKLRGEFKVKSGSDYMHPNAPTLEGQYARLAWDETLSYLGNAAADPKTTTPELRKLAEHFGVDWVGKEKPITSVRDLKAMGTKKENTGVNKVIGDLVNRLLKGK